MWLEDPEICIHNAPKYATAQDTMNIAFLKG